MKTIKNAVSILLCVAMLVSMCAIGTNAEDFVIDDDGDDVVTTDGYSMSVKLFVGSGGNVLIANLVNLTLSDTSDLTVTLYTAGANDTMTPYCGFAANEIIVEQPNEYHDCIELYLKNDKVPADNDGGDYILRIESGTLTDSNGGVVNAIDKTFSPRNIFSPPFSYRIDREGSNFMGEEPGVIGNRIILDLLGFEGRKNSFIVTTDTLKILSVNEDKSIAIIGAGDAQFTVKYNDFVYETWTFKTYTKAAYFIDSHTVHSFIDYLRNIEDALLFIVDIPGAAVAISLVGLPIFPIVLPVVFVGLILYYFVNIFSSFFGVILSP